MIPGDRVYYFDAFGERVDGAVSRIVDGRVYVDIVRANTRGKRVQRVCEVWFDAHETKRLIVTKETL